MLIELKELIAPLIVVAGHVWRTESQRAVMKNKIETLERRQKEDREASEARRAEDRAEIRHTLSEIQTDLKELIRRVGD